MKRGRNLEIQEDLHLQEKIWTIERIGWTLMAGALVAGLLGAFDEGPLSRRTQSDNRSFTVEYVRFGHYKTPLELEVYTSAGEARDGRVSIELDYEFLSRIQITRITPRPITEALTSRGVMFSFPADDEEGSFLITIAYEPKYVGNLVAKVSLRDTSQLSVTQFIYP
jgi:hypothetical protein